jgi:peptide-methionine (S)-S-oxide reductase
MDDALQAGALRHAVLAGGCFWGVQKVFQHMTGVTRAVSGYAGGLAETADYKTVCTGTTGHAEAVHLTYDPAQLTFGGLLRVFFSVAHDPTQLDRQGPDVGSQYRSAIFAQDDEQLLLAQAYLRQLDQAGVFDQAIVTRLEPRGVFYPAEAYHQDYATLHPENQYVSGHDLPKIQALARLYPELFLSRPTLVNPD